MITLQDVKKVVDTLSPEERRELREYLEQRESTEQSAPELTPQERARRLNEAFDQLRDGLSQQQLDEMTQAMNGRMQLWPGCHPLLLLLLPLYPDSTFDRS